MDSIPYGVRVGFYKLILAREKILARREAARY